MAKVGCLGDIVFQASESVIQTIDNAVWSGSANYSTHKRHLTDALTEFTGLGADEFTFDITLSAFLGVNPMDAIMTLWDYERSGKAIQLVLGDKGYGKYRWVVKSHKIKMQRYDGCGNLLDAKVSVSLLEYLKGGDTP